MLQRVIANREIKINEMKIIFADVHRSVTMSSLSYYELKT